MRSSHSCQRVTLIIEPQREDALSIDCLDILVVGMDVGVDALSTRLVALDEVASHVFHKLPVEVSLDLPVGREPVATEVT